MSKSRGGFVFIALAALMLAVSPGAWAEPPEDSGGGPPSGKGRKPDNPGSSIRGDLLGDLWVVVRDVSPTGDGKPIGFTWEWTDACYDAAEDFDPTLEGCFPTDPTDNVPGGCAQPITFVPLDPPVINGDGEVIEFSTSLHVDSYGASPTVYLIPLDPECKIPEGYETTWGEQTIEVDSGRLALARTTDYVIQAAYEEAVAVINTAVYGDTDDDGADEPPVYLDAAGRLVLTLLDTEGLPYPKTVDSPRENLALFERIMVEIRDNDEGCLPGVDTARLTGDVAHLACGADPDGQDRDLLRAASFLAGAADKSGSIDIDEVIYLNSILRINTVEESSTGSLFVTNYFDFKDDFTYNRLIEYKGVTADLLQPGTTLLDGYPTSFDVVFKVDIDENVFGATEWDGSTFPYPVVNFVRAADDAVRTINYIHNYELPEYLLPPTP